MGKHRVHFRPRPGIATGGRIDNIVMGSARPSGARIPHTNVKPPGCKIEKVGTAVNFADPTQFNQDRPDVYRATLVDGKIIPNASIRNAKRARHQKSSKANHLVFEGETVGQKLDKMTAYMRAKGYAV